MLDAPAALITLTFVNFAAKPVLAPELIFFSESSNVKVVKSPTSACSAQTLDVGRWTRFEEDLGALIQRPAQLTEVRIERHKPRTLKEGLATCFRRDAVK